MHATAFHVPARKLVIDDTHAWLEDYQEVAEPRVLVADITARWAVGTPTVPCLRG